MADNLAEAIELVAMYRERTAEHVGGLEEVKEFCHRAAAILADTLGGDNEQAGELSVAASATEVVVGLAQSTLSEMDQLLGVLQRLQ